MSGVLSVENLSTAVAPSNPAPLGLVKLYPLRTGTNDACSTQSISENGPPLNSGNPSRELCPISRSVLDS